jgi:hypothetical protein
LTAGDILCLEKDQYQTAEIEYHFAASVVTNALSAPDLATFDNDLLSQHFQKISAKQNPAGIVLLTDIKKILKNCTGLDIIKGEIFCRMASMFLQKGDIKSAQEKLKIASGLPLSLNEKVLLINTESVLRH